MDAHYAKGMIESMGIVCFLFDENIVGTNPLFDISTGGIKLKIAENDIAEVQKLLEELENDNQTDDLGNPIICPNCKSHKIIINFKSMKDSKGCLAAIFSLLLMSYPLHYKIINKCKACDNEF